jgi:hypothetical protein
MGWKGCGRKRSWPDFRQACYPEFCLDGPMETAKACDRIATLELRDLNPGHTECETGKLPIRT